jgi:hypothetical protein
VRRSFISTPSPKSDPTEFKEKQSTAGPELLSWIRAVLTGTLIACCRFNRGCHVGKGATVLETIKPAAAKYALKDAGKSHAADQLNDRWRVCLQVIAEIDRENERYFTEECNSDE